MSLKIKRGDGEWGMGYGEWGMGPNPKPPIPNPQSPIPNPQSPRDYLYKKNIYLIHDAHFKFFSIKNRKYISKNIDKTF